MKKPIGNDWTADRVVALAAFVALLVLFCMSHYADYDLWWHLKLGEGIVTNLEIPWQDTFSYTVAGRDQFTGEWLADALIFIVFSVGGFLGLNLLKSVLLATALYFVWLQIKPRAGDAASVFAAAVITLLVVLFALRFRLFVRPYLFSLPFLAAYLYLLAGWLSGRQTRQIYLLPILMLLWANMSVGAVFGIFAIGLAAVIEGLGKGSWRLLPIFFVSFLTSLVNPETYHMYALAINLTSDPYRTFIGEYQPATLDILFGSGLRYTLGFQVLAAGGLFYFLFLRGWKNVFYLLLFLFLFYESLRQIRLIELFSIVAAPGFAAGLSWMLKPLPQRLARLAPAANYMIAVAVLASMPTTVFDSPTYSFGVGLKPNAFPEEALKFLQDQRVSGRMFNSYSFGGYIIWRGNDRKVLIDGRYRRVYTVREYGEYNDALDSAEAWQALEQKHGFDYALLEYDLKSRRFPVHLSKNQDWALVYWDNHSLVYVKRTAERQSLISSRAYVLARPTFLDFSYLDDFSSPGKINEALLELDREVALSPDNQFVRLARVYLRYQLGGQYFPQIREDLERILNVKPDFAIKHSALAIVLAAMGEPERAKVEVLRALELDPLDEAALAQGRALGMKLSTPGKRTAGHP